MTSPEGAGPIRADYHLGLAGRRRTVLSGFREVGGASLNERIIHRVFEVGIVLKAVHGIIECVSGIVLYLVSTTTIIGLVQSITQSELVEDPLLQSMSEQASDDAVVVLIADDPALTQLVEATIAGIIATDADVFRPGLQPYDVAQFIIATALSLLLQTVPGTNDPDVARRYLETFILPAIVADPPPATRVFPPA